MVREADRDEQKINSMTSIYEALEAELQIHEPKPMKRMRFLIDRVES
jgi:hypothetical protein